MPNSCDPKLLQGLVRQARKDRLVYLILAECRLIFPRPRPRNQTTMSMIASLLRSPRIMIPSLRRCLAETLC